MKTPRSSSKVSASDNPAEEHNPLNDAARAIGTAVGRLSNRLGISSPRQTKSKAPSRATATRKSASRTKAKSAKAGKPAAKKR
jgi:hypothetical protein